MQEVRQDESKSNQPCHHMNQVILAFLFMSIFACSAKKNSSDTKISAHSEKITSDTCSFCLLEPFLIEPVAQNIETKIKIDYPIAIELLDRAKFVELYDNIDNKERYDTLMILLKMKHSGDRNIIYRLSELSDYYNEGIKPTLLMRKISITDTIKNERYITIVDESEKYLIDLDRYRKDDGVIMFTPGKKPIFWTMEKDEKYCYDYSGFPKWYFSCP